MRPAPAGAVQITLPRQLRYGCVTVSDTVTEVCRPRACERRRGSVAVAVAEAQAPSRENESRRSVPPPSARSAAATSTTCPLPTQSTSRAQSPAWSYASGRDSATTLSLRGGPRSSRSCFSKRASSTAKGRARGRCCACSAARCAARGTYTRLASTARRTGSLERANRSRCRRRTPASASTPSGTRFPSSPARTARVARASARSERRSAARHVP